MSGLTYIMTALGVNGQQVIDRGSHASRWASDKNTKTKNEEMNNKNKEISTNHDVEVNISEEEIVLAPLTELYDEAKEIAQGTKHDNIEQVLLDGWHFPQKCYNNIAN